MSEYFWLGVGILVCLALILRLAFGRVTGSQNMEDPVKDMIAPGVVLETSPSAGEPDSPPWHVLSSPTPNHSEGVAAVAELQELVRSPNGRHCRARKTRKKKSGALSE